MITIICLIMFTICWAIGIKIVLVIFDNKKEYEKNMNDTFGNKVHWRRFKD